MHYLSSQITGPLSSPEYMSHLPKAGEYRALAPGSQPLRARVPAAEDDRVYNIKYFSEWQSPVLWDVFLDFEMHIGHKYYSFDAAASKEALQSLAEAPTPGKKWSKPFKPILEEDNNGYTL
ncbi:hypothetical protein QBZ16_004628 [Prototheca wickerhamii]|uniref:Uncharacterized protein n=1 Tax=Prototheca wickerhamii TaxID=3111 RepID=A0AAD9IJJ1_PROWI|nr:hypothetical protein QBZ16_004628 [Prototheca wickerhamii]